MSKIERAVIMAAGTGTRLRPVTETVPKPLIKVNGVSMIETIINALHSKGIFEIYVVVGYLKECFSFLETKYDNLTLIENPHYNTCNNVSSLYAARNHLQQAVIIDGDQIVNNAEIFDEEITKSGYSCVWNTGKTDEWFLTLNEGKVVSCSKSGGENGWQLYGVSRWNKADGALLKKCVETEFEDKQNRSIYWDELALFIYAQQFDLSIYEIKSSDIQEIDTLKELADKDSSYQKFLKEV